MNPKTLYISDLDGTLLNGDSVISDASRALLNEAIGRGAMFSIATARTPSTVSRIVEGLDLNLPLVVMTGSAVWDARTRQYLRRETFKPETARAVLDAILRHGIPAFIYRLQGDIIHITHNGPLSAEEQKFIDERIDSPYKRFHLSPDGTPVFPDGLDDVILFYAMQPSHRVEECYRDICRIPDCNPIYYFDAMSPDTGILEVFTGSASKANAMKWLKEHCGADRVVAFGDNLNDLPLLRAADVAVAVGNAVQEVKDIADFVIGPNTDDSVAKFISSNFS